MPRAKNTGNGGPAISKADLEELQAAVAGTLSKVRINEWPNAEWSRLAVECLKKGYTIVVSPQMGGRGVRVSIPVGQARIPIEAMTDQELLEGIRALILAVEKLPHNG